MHQIATRQIGNWQDRPTIIFLHDSLGCIELWRDFPEKLGQACKCNVLIYDREGYGQSEPFKNTSRGQDYLEIEADRLYQLLQEWEINESILYGHSDGGSIALIMAAKYGHVVSGIITEGAHIFVEDVTIECIERAIQSYQTTDLKTKLEKYHGSKTDALFWAWAATWTSKDFRSWRIDHFLPNIQCPCMIIQGDQDEYGTLEQVDGIVQQVSHPVTTLILKDVGHTPHKEMAQEVLKQTARFISHLNATNNYSTLSK